MLVVALVLAGMVWSRLAYWQVAQHGLLAMQAQAQYRELVELPALRGAIFDRNLTQLVVNTTVYSAFVSPDQVAAGDRERVAGGLASVLGVDRAKVTTLLQSNSKFAYISRRFAKTKADQLRALKLPGVGLQEETQRSYLPGIGSGNTLAANLLGFVNWNGDGKYGLEEKYQKVLSGTPGYISNYFNHTDSNLFKDNVLSYVYEPGSVMKVVTLSGAINAGAIAPDTVINDPGVLSVGGYRIYDWDRRNHGNVDYTYVLAHSLNVGAMKAMQAEGHAAFYSNLQAFGLTKPSGIDVAGENYLLPPAADQMSDSQFATASFGQGIDVNMIQMLAATNIVANGGKYAPPHVVERVGTHINPILLQPQRQAITPQTAAKMTAMMQQVVQKGSGWTSRIKGFELDQAGKTGTSQIPVNGQYTQDVWTSFVGFLPAQHPRFTMLVVIRKPHYPGSDRDWTLDDGHMTAEPIWQKIAQTLVVNWHITPDPH